jgi:MoaA/NifB/PqqE/SkfB family radical SAM enzyme
MSEVIPETLAELPPLPLFVAVNRGCDMQCWYCTEHGENRSVERGRLLGQELDDTLAAAYDSGVRTFRFTGGEPTLLGPLGDIMLNTQALGEDVRVALTTNGSGLERLLPTLEKLQNPSVFISVDTYDDRRDDTQGEGKKLDKWLSPKIREIIDKMPENVQTRMNFVLTAANKEELPKLIDYAVEHKIDVKIFELLLRDYYYVSGNTTQQAFMKEYRSVRTLLPEFTAKYGAPIPYPGTGGRGMPMFSFQAGESKIVCFDSNAGSHYGDVCDTCPLFPCQEGLYALTLDSNGVLHPSGCPNEETYVNIAASSAEERKEAFKHIANMVGQATLRPDVPNILTLLSAE